jgi:hypothetical protein
MIRCHNMHPQAHVVMVKKDGKQVSRIIPAHGFIELSSDEMAQDVFDKFRRGVVRLENVASKKEANTETTEKKDKKSKDVSSPADKSTPDTFPQDDFRPHKEKGY